MNTIYLRDGARIGLDVDGAVRFALFPKGLSFDQADATSIAIAFLERAPALIRESFGWASDTSPMLNLTEHVVLGEATSKQISGVSIVAFDQLVEGVPLFAAGVTVVVDQTAGVVRAATSTAVGEVNLSATLSNIKAAKRAEIDAAEMVSQAFPHTRIEVGSTRTIAYEYQEAHRLPEATEFREPAEFSLQVGEVPDEIRSGATYHVIAAVISTASERFGSVDWDVFVEPHTRAVLRLRPRIAAARGSVFPWDPITLNGMNAPKPSASDSDLAICCAVKDLPHLASPVDDVQSLTGTYVSIVDTVLPASKPPSATPPYDFIFHPRSDEFAAVNAYYHCDAFFQMLDDFGFDVINEYFRNTSFPIGVDHRGFGGLAGGGEVLDAYCNSAKGKTGVGQLYFGLADISRTQETPIGIAVDRRVVLHELGGHGILLAHVDSPNMLFSHSAGDSFAAILAAPASFVKQTDCFPWLDSGRTYDRSGPSWSWGPPFGKSLRANETILTGTHVTLYEAIGGASNDQSTRAFAANCVAFLMLRTVSELTANTNPRDAESWAWRMIQSDSRKWTWRKPAHTYAGGALSKVIRWAFESHGMYRYADNPTQGKGDAPDVDIYLNDGRSGRYEFRPERFNCRDIWNRLDDQPTIGHQDPSIGQVNYIFARVRNRGRLPAVGVMLRCFSASPSLDNVFPTDWRDIGHEERQVSLAGRDAEELILGPIPWTPDSGGDVCISVIISTAQDPSNVDSITDAVDDWRLVPHDNNIGQRIMSVK